MEFEVSNYGRIKRENAAWMYLEMLYRHDERHTPIRPEDMRVGELATGHFRASGVATTHDVRRVA